MPSKIKTFGKIIRWKAGEIHRLLLNTIGGTVFTRLTVQSLATEINQRRTGVKTHEKSPTTLTLSESKRIERILVYLREKRAWLVRKMSYEVDVPESSLWFILREEFRFQKLFRMLFIHLLSEDKEIWKSNICNDNLISLRRHLNLLYKILIIDEILVKLYTPHKNFKYCWGRPRSSRH